jgi:hypothetical protein
MIANTLRVLGLVVCVALAGRFDMQDDEAATAAAADDARAAAVQLAAERACGGDVVQTPRGLRCAEPDATGTMVARLVEVPR